MHISLTRCIPAALALMLAATPAAAVTESILYNFTGTDGMQPYSGLIRDSDGNFYGTTYQGGTHHVGTAFELSQAADGSWYTSVLWSFAGRPGDGSYPETGLLLSGGTLWGLTAAGGAVTNINCSAGCGSFFGLSKVGGVWAELPLFSFPGGGAGYDPIMPGHLIQDGNGNFYGTAYKGGAYNQGAVIQLSFTNNATVETVLYSFHHTMATLLDGATPQSGLIMDASGNLYGTTLHGGSTSCNSTGCGTVYELSPPAVSGGPWTEKVLHVFQGGTVDGSFPIASLVFDSSGNLYGTTTTGGFYGKGTVFKLSPNGGGSWSETGLFNFGSTTTDGFDPGSSLVIDSARNLYGVTRGGGTLGHGTVFKLTPNLNTWNETNLYSFAGGHTDGADPWGELYRDTNGDLYGTTTTGGTYLYGTVFKIVP